jgi:hypothetical protein
MARGNGRPDIVCDDADRDRLHEHLGRAAIRCCWRVYAFAIMSNHLHVALKTPQPNLARGVQASLSGCANAWSPGPLGGVMKTRACSHFPFPPVLLRAISPP